MMIFRYWFWVISTLSFAAISSALIAEYIFYLEPCSMCLKQRHPYYFILIIFVLFLVIHNFPRIWFYLGVQLASIYGLFYSIWHVGIEQKILPGPTSCSGGLNISNSAESLKEQIVSKIIINCDILDKKSKIRTFFEKNKYAICIPFYADNDQTLSSITNNFFKGKKIVPNKFPFKEIHFLPLVPLPLVCIFEKIYPSLAFLALIN